MSPLTRRDFLKRSGALLAAAPVVTLDRRVDAPHETLGRAFDVTDVHVRPDLSSAVVSQLAPDSTNEITTVRNGWYQVADGWVQRSALQPIAPYYYPVVSETINFWAEAIAPTSVVKAWCAGRAPVVARLGFGAVVYVMDRMVDDYKQVWYGVAAEPGSLLVGWTPALHYERLTSPPDPLSASSEGEQVNNQTALGKVHNTDRKNAEALIRITKQRELVVYDGRNALVRMSIYTSELRPGATTISRVHPGGSTPFGLSWLMRLANGYPVYGAFWHNRFGEMGNSPSIELSTFAARWLYERLQSDVKVVIE